MAILFTIPRQKQIMLGAWTEGLYSAESQKLQPEKLDAFESLIDKKLSIAHYYRGWEALSDPNLVTEFEILGRHKWQAMINVNPYFFSQCPASDLPLYKAIATGKCDDFLRRAGKNLSQVKQPFYLLFAWEMNNDLNAWSVTTSGSSSQDFIDAWRHMHQIFEEEKATNVIWVFCPNIPDVAATSYRSLYPGDDYVDWIGLDGYNWGTTQSWSEWISFRGVFMSPYTTLTEIAPTKPLMIAEVNTTDQGGDKGNWYREMFKKEIPTNFPKIAAIVIYNEDRTVQEKVNWKVDVSEDSLQGFKDGVRSRYYK